MWSSVFIRKKSLTVSFSMLCHIYQGSNWRGLIWSSLSCGEKINQRLLWYKSFFCFSKAKTPNKAAVCASVFIDALVCSFCFLLYVSCLLGHLVLKMNVLPGVKAEAAPGFTASVGLMITGLLSPISHLWHPHAHKEKENFQYLLTDLNALMNTTSKDNYRKKGARLK